MSIKSTIEHDFPMFYKYLVEKKYFIDSANNKKLATRQGPEAVIKKLYAKFFDKEPELDNPQTFNEKLQWLKLNWYDERAQMCADKNLVREYVKSKGLEHLLIPQLAVYERPEDIDISKLPDKFVLKPSHDSGHTIICIDKLKFDLKKVQKQLKRYLAVDYEFKSGEWVYASKHKSIVCEEYLKSDENNELTDYKFHCFNGNPEFLYTSFGQYTSGGIKMDFYDINWNKLNIKREHYPNSNIQIKKPDNLDKLIEYSRILSEGYPFSRIDFMKHYDNIYIGEITFFTGGGLDKYKPEESYKQISDLLILPEKSFPSPWEIIHPEINRKV